MPGIVEFMLIAAIIMPPNVPDKMKHIPQPSLETCLEMAKVYMEGVDLKNLPEGATGVAATCAMREKPGKDS